MRILLEGVVLDLPGVVVAEPVAELDLVERLLKKALLALLVPGAWELVLVEDPELHAHSPPPAPTYSPSTL